jgi:hypothetical protein
VITVEPLDLSAASQPDLVAAAVTANAAADVGGPHPGHGPGPEITSVRTAEHKGHRIVIRTRYEIEVDGRPFEPHIVVDNAGRVHYHGLPTRDFASMVALVQKAIDVFPGDFAQDADDGHHGGGGHHHGAGGLQPDRDAGHDHRGHGL